MAAHRRHVKASVIHERLVAEHGFGSPCPRARRQGAPGLRLPVLSSSCPTDQIDAAVKYMHSSGDRRLLCRISDQLTGQGATGPPPPRGLSVELVQPIPQPDQARRYPT